MTKLNFIGEGKSGRSAPAFLFPQLQPHGFVIPTSEAMEESGFILLL